jgi:excalibur calcium-binding domain-containing protein
MKRVAVIAMTAGLLSVSALSHAAQAAQPTRVTTIWENCTTYNHQYAHGVGRAHAHDHTSGTPVRNFLHSTPKYNVAMNHNSDLDRDKDGIACEKA